MMRLMVRLSIQRTRYINLCVFVCCVYQTNQTNQTKQTHTHNTPITRSLDDRGHLPHLSCNQRSLACASIRTDRQCDHHLNHNLNPIQSIRHSPFFIRLHSDPNAVLCVVLYNIITYTHTHTQSQSNKPNTANSIPIGMPANGECRLQNEIAIPVHLMRQMSASIQRTSDMNMCVIVLCLSLYLCVLCCVHYIKQTKPNQTHTYTYIHHSFVGCSGPSAASMQWPSGDNATANGNGNATTTNTITISIAIQIHSFSIQWL